MHRLGLRHFIAACFSMALVLSAAPPAVPVTAAPEGASRFTDVKPARIMDTRSGVGVAAGVRQPGSSTSLQVTGSGGVPADATAVALNVTIAESISQGFVQVYPTGDGTPGASSNLNVPGAGSTRANLVMVPVGDGGQITFYTSAGGHLIADVFGYFSASAATSAGRFVGLTSTTRTLDTRDARQVPVANPGDAVNCGDFSTWSEANEWFWRYSRHGDPAKLDADGNRIPCESLPANPGVPFQPPNLYKPGADSTFRLPVLTDASPDGGVVPPGATAVVLNITAAQAASPGFLQLYASPSGAANGAHSNLNFIPNETAPNLAIVPIGADGAITIYAKSSVHLIADVIGYFTGDNAPRLEAGLFVPFSPTRLIDSELLGGPLPPKTLQTKNLASLAGLDARDVSAMFLNVTLANSLGAGYLQVFPTGGGTPGATSTVNVSSAGATRPNAAITGLVDGNVSVYHFAGGRYVLDAAGYFTSDDDPAVPTPDPTDPVVPTPGSTERAAALCGRTGTEVAGQVENDALVEASGIVASRAHPGVFWSHNDGADGRLFGIGADGADLGVHSLGIGGLVDVEDMAFVTGPNGDDLLLADFGDNQRRRASIRIYRFAEPDPATPGPIGDVEVLEFVYPDGAHNAETLLVDEASNRVVIVTKEQTAGTGAPEGAGPTEASFVFEGSLDGGSGETVELTQAGTIDMPALEERSAKSPSHPAALFGFAGVPTGGDVSIDGSLVVVRTYETIWVWPRENGQSVADAFASSPCEVKAALEPQGEAVAFDGIGLVTLGERANQPLNLLGR